MSLIEDLFNLLKDVESKDELVDGFIMNPIKKGYKLFYENQYIASVNFIYKNNKEEYDMETACNEPNNYNVYITEIKQDDKVKLYINKLKNLGFINIIY